MCVLNYWTTGFANNSLRDLPRLAFCQQGIQQGWVANGKWLCGAERPVEERGEIFSARGQFFTMLRLFIFSLHDLISSWNIYQFKELWSQNICGRLLNDWNSGSLSAEQHNRNQGALSFFLRFASSIFRLHWYKQLFTLTNMVMDKFRVSTSFHMHVFGSWEESGES